jgi:hypothetical protein
VHAHRVDVLDRTDDHDVVVAVAHDFELELPPPEHRLLEQDLADGARVEALGDPLVELGGVARDAAAVTTKGERGPHDQGQSQLIDRPVGLRHRGDDRRPRHTQTRIHHRLAKHLPVLRAPDRVVVGADQLDAEAVERSIFVQRLGQVQAGLAAERPQQRLRAFFLDHRRDRLGRERLDVGGGRELGIGHDRRGVRIDQHDLVPLLEQHLAGLHTRIIEFGGLPDHDRPRADDQDLFDVVAARHQEAAISRKRSKR